MENAPKLNPAQAAKLCASVIIASRKARENGSNLNTVPLMISDPGVGKTSIARQVAKALGYDGLIVITPTMHSIFDLRGLPYVDGTETKFAASQILPQSEDAHMLILIDELADAPLHEQSGFYQLLLDRKMGEYELPAGCDVIGGTNDETMGACSNPLSSAIKTRVASVYVQSELQQTLKYALRNAWHPRVIGFIKCNPDVLAAFNPEDYAGGATARNLEQISNQEFSGMTSDDQVNLAISCGMLGLDFGTRYATYRQLDIPDVDEVYNTPQSAEIPSDNGRMFAYCAAIASGCDTIEKFEATYEYAQRHDRVNAVGLIMDVIRAHPAHQNTKTYTEVVLKYGDIMA